MNEDGREERLTSSDDHGDEYGLSKRDLERMWSFCCEVGIIHSSEKYDEME